MLQNTDALSLAATAVAKNSKGIVKQVAHGIAFIFAAVGGIWISSLLPFARAVDTAFPFSIADFYIWRIAFVIIVFCLIDAVAQALIGAKVQKNFRNDMKIKLQEVPFASGDEIPLPDAVTVDNALKEIEEQLGRACEFSENRKLSTFINQAIVDLLIKIDKLKKTIIVDEAKKTTLENKLKATEATDTEDRKKSKEKEIQDLDAILNKNKTLKEQLESMTSGSGILSRAFEMVKDFEKEKEKRQNDLLNLINARGAVIADEEFDKIINTLHAYDLQYFNFYHSTKNKVAFSKLGKVGGAVIVFALIVFVLAENVLTTRAFPKDFVDNKTKEAVVNAEGVCKIFANLTEADNQFSPVAKSIVRPCVTMFDMEAKAQEVEQATAGKAVDVATAVAQTVVASSSTSNASQQDCSKIVLSRMPEAQKKMKVGRRLNDGEVQILQKASSLTCSSLKEDLLAKYGTAFYSTYINQIFSK